MFVSPHLRAGGLPILDADLTGQEAGWSTGGRTGMHPYLSKHINVKDQSLRVLITCCTLKRDKNN